MGLGRQGALVAQRIAVGAAAAGATAAGAVMAASVAASVAAVGLAPRWAPLGQVPDGLGAGQQRGRDERRPEAADAPRLEQAGSQRQAGSRGGG